jgi:hypothetical protein
VVRWIVPGIIVVLCLLVSLALSRASTYRRLFADEHFLEVARAAHRMKLAALANVMLSDDELPKPPDDPRIFVSTEGLVIVYTVRRQKQQFVHHCSVSIAGGYTAHAVGGSFIAFMTKLVGLPWDKMSYEIGNSTVHHGELVVGPEEHEAIAAQNVPTASLENVKTNRRASIEAKSRFAWYRHRA